MGKILVESCIKDNVEIKGLKIITPMVYGDERGYFFESYNQKDMADAGLNMAFVQDNQSLSVKGVLRGLHYQKKYPQGKLVRIVRGKVFDVTVDLRSDSETFGMWYGLVLSSENKKQLYIPEGFAHGFLVLSEVAEFCYKCTDFYHPEDEGGLIWDDPAIGIKWPVNDDTKLIISPKDQKWPELKDNFGTKIR